VLNVLAVARHPVGGIRSYLKTMYPALAARGYRFSLVVVEEPEVRVQRRESSERDLRAALDGPAFEHVDVSPGRPFRALAVCIARLLAAGRYDVIHAHGFTAGAASALANLPFGLPQVLTVHETLSDQQFRSASGRLRRLVLTQLFRRMEVIQAVSQDARENLLHHLPGLPRRHVLVIPNGIDVDRFSARPLDARASWRAELDIADDTVLFGFLGRLMPEKGYHHLVDAVERLAHDREYQGRFTVLVVNDGCYIRELQSDLQRRGLSGYFRFMGLLPDVAGVLGQLDAVVMPSLREAGPLVPMEALVAGCPLIASSCIGLREVIAQTPAFAVPPGNAAALADAMKTMIANGKWIKHLTAAYAPSAKSRFDVAHAAQALDAVFRGLAGEPYLKRARSRASASPSISKSR
jgi:glycosyltransferase involved in cell wall biosynthesis